MAGDSLQAKHIADIPFTLLSDNVVILRTCLDNYPDSLNFLFDTGSGGISMDSATASTLHLPQEKTSGIIRGIAGIKPAIYTRNHTLRFKEMNLDSLDFFINDYSILTQTLGIKIDGIIGYGFLKNHIVSLDYENQHLHVFLPGAYRYPKNGYLLRIGQQSIPVIKIESKDNVVEESNYYFDTGAGLCILYSEESIQKFSLLKPRRKRYVTTTSGLGGLKQMDMTVVKSIKLGAYKFRNVPVYIFNDTYNLTTYPSLNGVVGNGLLHRFNIVFNYPKKEIFLKPNTIYHEVFDYSYTGMQLGLEDAGIVVEDVIKNSPADKAGIQVGDIIITINNNFFSNLQDYKNLISRAVKSKIKIIVKRGGEPFQFTLYVRSIK
ncbi:MAG: aspartyl protease family protein [Chitinophagaceae bacterium]|nr:aspartyl protease family protein [Chitinophagaceae bacterium]